MAVLVWLANPVFVGIPVVVTVIAFLTMRSPQSLAEVILECQKIVLIGGLTLAGVAVVEIILFAVKRGRSIRNVKFIVMGVLGLLADVIFASGLYLAALLYTAQHHETNEYAELTIELIADLIVLAVAIMIAVRFKYLEQPDEDVEQVDVNHQQ
jgi:hypothetical protein